MLMAMARECMEPPLLVLLLRRRGRGEAASMVLVVMLDDMDPVLILKLKLGDGDLVLTSRSSVAMCIVARDRDVGGELSQQAGFLQFLSSLW